MSIFARKGTKAEGKKDIWVDVRIVVYFRDQQKPLKIEYRHKAGTGGDYWAYSTVASGKTVCKIEGYHVTHLIDADVIRRLTLQTKYSDGREEQPDHTPKNKKEKKSGNDKKTKDEGKTVSDNK